MRGPLAPVVFVLAIAIATGFLFMAVMGIMILWALPVIALSLMLAARRLTKSNGNAAPRAGYNSP
jgi:hypothetical protein